MDDLIASSRAGEIELDPFFYEAIFPIGLFIPGANVPINIPIDNDADFVIRYGNMAAYSAPGTPVVNPDYAVVMTDSSSGRNLQNQPIHTNTIFGTAQLPFIWPEPKILKGGGNFTVTLINNDVAAALVSVVLCGFKVFKVRRYER
jgi:hypothetical protein